MRKKNLVTQASDGALGVENALSSSGFDISFNDVYLDWITACVIDDTECYEGIYGFETVDYKIKKRFGIGQDFQVEKKDVRHYYYGFDVKEIFTSFDNFSFDIENPHPYALGISVAIRDDNGWNVTQIINTKQTNQISLYCEGENVQEIYVITSLISDQTPTDFGVVYSLDEVLSIDLDYEFRGIPVKAGSGSYTTLIVFSSLLFIGVLIVLRRRK